VGAGHGGLCRGLRVGRLGPDGGAHLPGGGAGHRRAAWEWRRDGGAGISLDRPPGLDQPGLPFITISQGKLESEWGNP
jgi:hypothetical protein